MVCKLSQSFNIENVNAGRLCIDHLRRFDARLLAQNVRYPHSKAKWSSKDKLGKWAGSKNKKADVGIPAKPQKRKRLKVNTYKMQDEEERQRICMSYAEDSMPDFLLKFGTVTKLIEDVSEFEMKLKAAETGHTLPWALGLLQERGGAVQGQQHLLLAGVAMSRWLDITRENGDVLPALPVRSLWIAANGAS